MYISSKRLSDVPSSPDLSFISNYRLKRVSADSKRGYKKEYVYIGPLCEWENSREYVGYVKRIDIISSVVLFVLYMSNFIPCSVNSNTGSALPQMFSIIPVLLITASAVEMNRKPVSGTYITIINAEHSVKIMKTAAGFEMLLCAAAAVFGIINLFSAGFSMLSALTVICFVLSAFLAVYLYKLHNALKYRMQPNPEKTASKRPENRK